MHGFPFFRASRAPLTSHAWHFFFPSRDFLVYLAQKSVKLLPFVIGMPFGSVVRIAIPEISESSFCNSCMNSIFINSVIFTAMPLTLKKPSFQIRTVHKIELYS